MKTKITLVSVYDFGYTLSRVESKAVMRNSRRLDFSERR